MEESVVILGPVWGVAGQDGPVIDTIPQTMGLNVL